MERTFLFCLLSIISICFYHVDSLSTFTEGQNERIMGGTIAPRIPWMASVRVVIAQTTYHTCGGFIINRRWVGTAAQCLTHKTTLNTAVAVGSNGVTGGEIYGLLEIQVHQNYTELTLENDIALLRTDREIVFSANVNSIHLATSNTFIPSTLIIYGWGYTAAGGSLNAVLLEGVFNVVTNPVCIDRFPYVARPYITDQHICTQFNTRATCPGDAGGPLVANGTVVGIASWVDPCVAAQTNVNVRISSYFTWITGFTQPDN